MRTIIAGALFAALVACGPRQVDVETGPRPTSDVSINFTNNASQAVNVYVVSGGTDVFLKQVAANSTELLPVQGIASGTTVRLKATTADGQRTYTSADVVLSGTYRWQVP